MPHETRTNSKELLQRFIADEELLVRYGVTEEELELLSTVSLFGSLSSAGDIVFLHPKEYARNQARPIDFCPHVFSKETVSVWPDLL